MNRAARQPEVSPRRKTPMAPAKIRPAIEPGKRHAELEIYNRQRTRAIHLVLWRQILASLIDELTSTGSYEVAVHLVAAPEMSQLNEAFLHHQGSTDVISFDYHAYPLHEIRPETKDGHSPDLLLHGEVYISVDDAVAQASRFQATWQEELARYAIHGLMHLQGFDDLRSAERYRMKRLESRWPKHLVTRFTLDQL